MNSLIASCVNFSDPDEFQSRKALELLEIMERSEESTGIKVKPENVAFIGTRCYESKERELAEKLNIKVFYAEEVKKVGFAKCFQSVISSFQNKGIKFGISFDMDCLDVQEITAVGTPVKNGLILNDVMDSFNNTNLEGLDVLEVVEYNPQLDKTGNDVLLLIVACTANIVGWVSPQGVTQRSGRIRWVTALSRLTQPTAFDLSVLSVCSVAYISGGQPERPPRQIQGQLYQFVPGVARRLALDDAVDTGAAAQEAVPGRQPVALQGLAPCRSRVQSPRRARSHRHESHTQRHRSLELPPYCVGPRRHRSGWRTRSS